METAITSVGEISDPSQMDKTECDHPIPRKYVNKPPYVRTLLYFLSKTDYDERECQQKRLLW